MLKAFLARERLAGHGTLGAAEGQGLVEYALILVLISVVSIGILTLLGIRIQEVFQSILDGLNGAG